MVMTFIGLCCAVYLFSTGAEPVQEIKSWSHLGPDCDYKNPVQWFFLKMLNCSMCTGFWVGLVYYQQLLPACILSIGAEVLTRILNRL